MVRTLERTYVESRRKSAKRKAIKSGRPHGRPDFLVTCIRVVPGRPQQRDKAVEQPTGTTADDLVLLDVVHAAAFGAGPFVAPVVEAGLDVKDRVTLVAVPHNVGEAPGNAFAVLAVAEELLAACSAGPIPLFGIEYFLKHQVGSAVRAGILDTHCCSFPMAARFVIRRAKIARLNQICCVRIEEECDVQDDEHGEAVDEIPLTLLVHLVVRDVHRVEPAGRAA